MRPTKNSVKLSKTFNTIDFKDMNRKANQMNTIRVGKMNN